MYICLIQKKATNSNPKTMRLQIIQDSFGKNTGVFIPIEDWVLIKNNYPNIETIDQEVPQWEKDIIDERLRAIALNPERLRPMSELFDELDKEI
jgi:hypothetical protein